MNPHITVYNYSDIVLVSPDTHIPGQWLKQQ